MMSRACALLPALVACMPALELAPCYSAADCPSGSTCTDAACVPRPDAGGDTPTCTVAPSTFVRTVSYPYTGDRVPPAALAFDGTRYWAVVEDVVPLPTPIFELYTVRLDALGEREASQADDPVTRGRSSGEPVAPFLERGPSGLVFGWNERTSSTAPYLGYAGPLTASGVTEAPVAFSGRIEHLVIDGAATFGALTLDDVPALQQLGSSTVARFDPALFAASAARTPGGDWLVVAERGDDVDVLRLSSGFVVRDQQRLISGADGEASAPRARWTGDALTVVFVKITAAGSIVQSLETDASGRITQAPQTLTATITGLPSWAYSPTRDEVAIAYARGGRVELLRLSRRTRARTVETIRGAGGNAIEPVIVDAGAEYAAAWLEDDTINGGYLLRMSRVVCR